MISRMKCLRALGLAAVFGLVASNGFAVEAKLRIDQKALSYEQETSKNEVGSNPSTTTKTTTLETNEADNLFITIDVDTCRLSISPFGGAVKFSHFFQKDLEVGLAFDLDSSKVDKPKNNNSTTDIGVFGNYYMAMGKNELEIGLAFTSKASKAEDDTGTTNDEKGSLIKLGADYYLPIADNFFYGVGLSYSMSNLKESVADSKTTSNTIGIDLASLRYKF